MTKLVLLLLLAVFSGCARAPLPAATAPARALVAQRATSGPATPTGIAMDAPWKREAYAYAVANVKHPAWGLAHAERDLRLALDLAAQDRLAVDPDVLFAAAYLHDLGGLPGFEQEGMDHAVRSAQLAEPLLKGWGFPMAKFPLVEATILGHVYYGKDAPTAAEARVFHDADLLDFLGAMGVARLLAATGEAPTMAPNLAAARKFAVELPGKLLTEAARAQAPARVAEMQAFFKAFDAESYAGKAI